MACGESPVYMGQKGAMTEGKRMSDIQARPVFDDSCVFIPNLLIDVQTRECDVLPAIIVHYLKGYFEAVDPGYSRLQSEFLTQGDLIRALYDIFNGHVPKEKIRETVSYLFDNRVIRKSIVNSDNDKTFYRMNDSDYLYLTLKGERLLKMLESDSVLLEIYREDIWRDYADEVYYKSSAELIMENRRKELFEDILALIREIYHKEDLYLSYVAGTDTRSAFYEIAFPITCMIMQGVTRSLSRSQNMEGEIRESLLKELSSIKEEVSERIREIGGRTESSEK